MPCLLPCGGEILPKTLQNLDVSCGHGSMLYRPKTPAIRSWIPRERHSPHGSVCSHHRSTTLKTWVWTPKWIPTASILEVCHSSNLHSYWLNVIECYEVIQYSPSQNLSFDTLGYECLEFVLALRHPVLHLAQGVWECLRSTRHWFIGLGSEENPGYVCLLRSFQCHGVALVPGSSNAKLQRSRRETSKNIGIYWDLLEIFVDIVEYPLLLLELCIWAVLTSGRNPTYGPHHAYPGGRKRYPDGINSLAGL